MGAVDEPIWKHDVVETWELADNCAKVTHRLFMRLTTQQQHPELQQRMYNANQYFLAAMKELEALEPCFPPEPRGS